MTYRLLWYGLLIRIPGFHPSGPGSIPGAGTAHSLFLFCFLQSHSLYYSSEPAFFKIIILEITEEKYVYFNLLQSKYLIDAKNLKDHKHFTRIQQNCKNFQFLGSWITSFEYKAYSRCFLAYSFYNISGPIKTNFSGTVWDAKR